LLAAIIEFEVRKYLSCRLGLLFKLLIFFLSLFSLLLFLEMDPALALMGLYLLLIDLLLFFVFPSLSLVLAAFSLDIDTSRDPTSFLSLIKASR